MTSLRTDAPRLPSRVDASMRTVVGLLLPVAAFAVELALRDWIRPHTWFLFFPSVFLSSWIASARVALVATAISVVLVWWILLPIEYAVVTTGSEMFPLVVFVGTGIAFAMFHHRMRETNRRLKQANEERGLFAALIDNSSDFIGIADTAGTPVYVNPAGRRMVGLAPDRPIGTTRIPDYYPPAQRAFAADVIVKSMVERGYWQGETYLRNWKTEAAIPVSDTHFMIRDPDTGHVVGMGTVTRDISERKQLERSLREATADLARAQSVAEVGSWRLDIARGTLTWSDETYRILGIQPGSPVTYDTFLACVHPDDREHVDRSWHAALAGAPYDLEHRIVVDGTIRWVREKADLELDEHGTLIGGIGIVQDVTERTRLTEELRRSEAMSSGILSISADAIISIDDQQRIVKFNEGAEHIFGYSKQEAIGSALEILLPERLRERHAVYVAEFARGPVVARRVHERTAAIIGLRKSGKEFPADASISKLEVDGERILTVALRDISEQKRHESEQRFLADVGSVLSSTLGYEETLTNVAELAVRDLADYCIIDIVEETGEIRRLKTMSRDPGNAANCERLQNVELDRTLPYLTRSALDAWQPVLIEELSTTALATYAQSEEHLAALRALEPRSVIAVPLIARGATIGAMALIASGPSARIYDQQDVNLAVEVARRAALAIDNARLYRVSRRAIQSRDDVLGIVAHDLRNPLNAIGLQAGMLGERGGEEERAGAAMIERAAHRMNRIIQDLLDVTRMEAGMLVLDRAPLSAQQAVSDAVEAQQLLASSRSIELRIDSRGDLPDVWADRDRLLQIFENLIGNALKFTSRGGRVIVGAMPKSGEVLFWVTDNGPGIAIDDQPHVFERFWQQAAGRRQGAGLGLPIVKGLVDAHGGHIWVESTPGRGCTFYFTIPTAVGGTSYAMQSSVEH